MPTTNDIKESYNAYLDKLDTPTIRHQAILNTFNNIIMDGCNVLDVGCGTGITSKHLATKAKSVLALDISPVLIKFAQEHNSRPNLEYVVADFTNWKCDRKFDFVSIVDVFEHIRTSEIPDFMNTLSSAVHDKTQIYLNIPTYDVLNYLKENKPEVLQIVDIPHEDATIYFREIGFIPAYSKLYWSQYIEYIFWSKSALMNIFDSIFKPKRSNVNG